MEKCGPAQVKKKSIRVLMEILQIKIYFYRMLFSPLRDWALTEKNQSHAHYVQMHKVIVMTMTADLAQL